MQPADWFSFGLVIIHRQTVRFGDIRIDGFSPLSSKDLGVPHGQHPFPLLHLIFADSTKTLFGSIRASYMQ